MKRLLLGLSVVTVCLASSAATRYVVKGNANAAEPYDGWDNAAADIQTAVDFASPGESVIVSNGVYEYGRPAKGKSRTCVSVAKAVDVRGFTGKPDDVVLRVTECPSGYSIQVASLSSGAMLSSVAIEGGCAGEGSGVTAKSGSVVSNCVIRNCHGSGSAIYNYNEGGAPLVTHCVISNNTADTSTGDTAAALFLGLGARCMNCLIVDNRASGNTAIVGGVFVYGPSAIFSSTIVRNEGRGFGALRVRQITGVVSNCVLAGNAAIDGGAGNRNWNQTEPYGNRSDRFWSCATDDADKINDRCFVVSPTDVFADYEKGDYRPKNGSSIVDAGAFWPGAPATDLGGDARVQGGGIDIGCYEFDASQFLPTIVTEGTTYGFSPQSVSFSATVPEAYREHSFAYAWDLDGDGETDSTDPAPFFIYAKPGAYDVTVTMTDLTTGKSGTTTRLGLVSLLPQKMLVSSGNPNAAFPYDTEDNAAATIDKALEAAMDGSEIEVLTGDYPISSRISVVKAVTLHGRSGRPGDVRVSASKTGVSLLSVGNAGALVHGMAFSDADVDFSGHALSMTGGGTVSNCIFRNCRTTSTGDTGAAVIINGPDSLVTHCVISNCVDSGSGANHSAGIELQNRSRAENCLIAGNAYTGVWETGAGGVLVRDGTMINCTIVTNASSQYAGGVRIKTVRALCNCVIAGNVCTGIRNAEAKDVYARCATDDETPLNANCICGEYASLFADPERMNFRPGPDSPLRDAGDSSVVHASVDLSGRRRLAGRRVDIGCYECHPGMAVIMR